MNRCSTCGQTLTMGDADAVCGPCQARVAGVAERPTLLLATMRHLGRLYRRLRRRLTRRERMPIDLAQAHHRRRTRGPE